MSGNSKGLILVGVFILGVLFALSFKKDEVESHAVAQDHSKADPQIALRQRGAYLMTITGCNDCHTPRDEAGKPIGAFYLAGHPANAPLPTWKPEMIRDGNLMTMAPTGTAFAGPWGTSVAPNITPDKETGIGNLSADALITSWRENKHWQVDRPILPPMPAPGYAAMTDDDIRAVHAFLMSIPAIKNVAPASTMAPPPPPPPASPSTPAQK